MHYSCDSTMIALVGFGAAFVSSLVTWLNVRRQIKAKYITNERAKWRDEIRMLTRKALKAILDKKYSEGNKEIKCIQNRLRILLNPFDCQDQAILDCMTNATLGQNSEEQADEFSKRISLLLKHDWERAKDEAGFLWCRCKSSPKRRPLECYGKCCACKDCGKSRCYCK